MLGIMLFPLFTCFIVLFIMIELMLCINAETTWSGRYHSWEKVTLENIKSDFDKEDCLKSDDNRLLGQV